MIGVFSLTCLLLIDIVKLFCWRHPSQLPILKGVTPAKAGVPLQAGAEPAYRLSAYAGLTRVSFVSVQKKIAGSSPAMTRVERQSERM